MGSARRIMQPILEGMLWMVAGSSWQVQGKELVGLLHVQLVAATGTFTEGRYKLRLSVSTLPLILVADHPLQREKKKKEKNKNKNKNRVQGLSTKLIN